jgi:AcrR family transcriptional regulator
MTRLQIIEAARKLLAHGGSNGISVSQVARVARVNRGTAYSHFGSREELIAATINHVSQEIVDKLYKINEQAFGEGFSARSKELVDELALFFLDNSELGRIWLFEVLARNDVSSDPLWRTLRDSIERFSPSKFGREGVDADVLAVMTFGAYFLWPLLVKADKLSPKERKRMAVRVSNEMMRNSLYGSLRPETVPSLVDAVRKAKAQLEGGSKKR